MTALFFLILIVCLFFGVGFLVVIGTLKRWPALVDYPPDKWWNYNPYGFMRKAFGENAIFYFHIFVGIVFMVGSIWILIYSLFWL